jgi:hypothetical protein
MPRVGRIPGGVADSPLVDDHGSASQALFGLALGCVLQTC